MAGRVLAELGAHITRLAPRAGDPLATPHPRFGVSPRLLWYSMDKELVEVDAAELPDVLDAALPDTDLLIDGLRPGELAALGLDAEALEIRNPRLIVLSLSDYGQAGPYRDWAGSALTNLALGGQLFRAGRPVDPPLPPPVELADTIGGITGALAAVTALAARGASGPGDRIDCSTTEACISVADWIIPTRSVNGVTTVRNGGGPIYPVYETSDGFVRLLNLSDRQWQAFKAFLGNPSELDAPELGVAAMRAAQAGLVDAVFARETEGRSRGQVVSEGQRARVSVVPVYRPEEIAGDPHYAERETIAKVTVAGAGELAVPRAFVRFGMAIPEPPRPPVRAAHVSTPVPGPALGAPLDFRRLRVVELGAGGVAPEAARYLGLLGADVVKVEARAAMDFLRTLPGAGRHEQSATFISSNRNKRSVELDLKTPGDRDTLLRMLDTADVFLENNAGGVCDRLGVGRETILARNPRLVYASAQMMGAWGPATAWTGFGPSNQALAGLCHLWTHPDNPRPEGISLAYPDHVAGRTMALAVVAALLDRQRTGQGGFIDLAQSECAMATIGEAFVEASLAGESRRRGYDHPCFAPHGVFPTLLPDEWLAVAVETDAHWRGLRRALGDPAWAADPALDTATGRLAARGTINERLSAWTRTFTRIPAAVRLQREGVPAMPVYSQVELLADPHLNAREFFELVNHPVVGWARYEGIGARFARLPLAAPSPAPLLGQHTDAVIKEWIGVEVGV